MGGTNDRAQVLRRPLSARLAGGRLALLGAVAESDDPGRVRAFFASGTARDEFASLPGDGHAEALEIREVSGGVMYDARATGPVRLALADGTAAEIHPDAPERALLAGRNVLLAFRLDEPPEVVADWLAYHTHHHGAEAALIVNRAPPETGHAAFASGLQAASPPSSCWSSPTCRLANPALARKPIRSWPPMPPARTGWTSPRPTPGDQTLARRWCWSC